MLREFFFSKRIINEWNILSEETIAGNSLTNFKRRLNNLTAFLPLSKFYVVRATSLRVRQIAELVPELTFYDKLPQHWLNCFSRIFKSTSTSRVMDIGLMRFVTIWSANPQAYRSINRITMEIRSNEWTDAKHCALASQCESILELKCNRWVSRRPVHAATNVEVWINTACRNVHLQLNCLTDSSFTALFHSFQTTTTTTNFNKNPVQLFWTSGTLAPQRMAQCHSACINIHTVNFLA